MTSSLEKEREQDDSALTSALNETAYDDAIQTYNSIEKNQNTWLGGQIRIADIYNNLGQHQKAINMVEN